MLPKYLKCFTGRQLREEAQFVVPQIQLLERRHLCQDRRHALQLVPRAVQHSQVYRRKRLNECFPKKHQLNQEQSVAYSSFHWLQAAGSSDSWKTGSAWAGCWGLPGCLVLPLACCWRHPLIYKESWKVSSNESTESNKRLCNNKSQQ